MPHSLELRIPLLSRISMSHLKDDSRQRGLVVAVLVGFRLCVFLPVLLIRLQGFPQPACDIRLKDGKGKAKADQRVET